MKRPSGVGCVFACLWGMSVWGPLAQAQNLATLYERASAIDPAVLGAQAQLRAVQQRQVQARAGFGPTAALVGSYNDTRYREQPEYDVRRFYAKQGSVQITQPLYRGALFPGLDSAQAQLMQAQAALDQARAESAQRLVEASFELFKARDALELARAQRVATEEQLRLAQRSFKVGTTPIIDVKEAEARAAFVAAQVSAAEFELDLKQQVLAELTGQGAPDLLTRGLDGQRLPALDAAAASGWLATAQDHSTQIQQARQALAAAEAEVNKAWHGHGPTMDLTYNYTHGSDMGTLTSAYPRGGKSSTLGVNLNVPLFASGATHAKVKEAQALRDKAASDVDSARRAVALGVRQSTQATLSAISQAHGLEVAVRSQEAAFQANRRGYEVGMKINAEVLDSQSRVFEARRDLSRARYDAWVGYIRLKAQAGQLDAPDIAALDAVLVPLTPASMDARPSAGSR